MMSRIPGLVWNEDTTVEATVHSPWSRATFGRTVAPMDDIDSRGHSVLTPEGEIQSYRAFARGLGGRYGAARVRRVVGLGALLAAIGLVVLAIFG
jgi:hypothetical protein